MHKTYLIKPASSLCNMNCKYCFYCDVSSLRECENFGIMNDETTHVLIDQALEESHEMTFAFQGGEPTIAGVDYFYRFIDYVNQHKQNHIIHYTIQSNGMLIDEKWVKLFKKYHFLVGLSIDGDEKMHDRVRVQQNKGTFHRVMQSLKLLQDNQIDYNVLTVLTSDLSKQAKKLYAFYKKHNIRYIQLIPCLPELNESNNRYSLSPKQFASFYIELFELWKEDFLRGDYYSILLFDQLMLIFQGKAPTLCSILGRCQLENVVEANGNVYPCDFYCTDEYLLGNIHKQSFHELDGHRFLAEKKRTCKQCKECKFQKICMGSCKRMNLSYFTKDYCGYKVFLEKTYQQLYMLANGGRL